MGHEVRIEDVINQKYDHILCASHEKSMTKRLTMTVFLAVDKPTIYTVSYENYVTNPTVRETKEFGDVVEAVDAYNECDWMRAGFKIEDKNTKHVFG